MKPVFQLVSDPGRGDCWRSCIASILELPVTDVPNFVGDMHDAAGNKTKHAQDLAREWLAARGYAILRIHERQTEYIDWVRLPGLYCIASVPSQRFPGGSHAVVCQFQRVAPDNPFAVRLAIVHDPQPLNKPYPDDFEYKGLEFLIPFQPRIDQTLPTPA